MNYLDIILSIPLLWGLYKGLSKGIVIELATLLALVLGIYGALHFAIYVQPFLNDKFSIDSSFLPIVSFALTFLAIVMLVRVLAYVIDRLLKLVALGLISRILGGIFGVLKVAFVISATLLVFNTFDNHLQLIPTEQKNTSLLYRPISKMVSTIVPNVSDAHSLIEEAERAWTQFDDSIRPH